MRHAPRCLFVSAIRPSSQVSISDSSQPTDLGPSEIDGGNWPSFIALYKVLRAIPVTPVTVRRRNIFRELLMTYLLFQARIVLNGRLRVPRKLILRTTKPACGRKRHSPSVYLQSGRFILKKCSEMCAHSKKTFDEAVLLWRFCQ